MVGSALKGAIPSRRPKASSRRRGAAPLVSSCRAARRPRRPRSRRSSGSAPRRGPAASSVLCPLDLIDRPAGGLNDDGRILDDIQGRRPAEARTRPAVGAAGILAPCPTPSRDRGAAAPPIRRRPRRARRRLSVRGAARRRCSRCSRWRRSSCCSSCPRSARPTTSGATRRRLHDRLPLVHATMPVAAVVPAGGATAPRPLLVFLHGFGGNQDSSLVAPMFAALAKLGARHPTSSSPTAARTPIGTIGPTAPGAPT